MEKKIKELEKILKYNFKKSSILEKSLTHKSFDNDINNEKLEFLGDRVLGLIISKHLLEIYPDEKEGIIDKKLANLVNKKTCTEISKSLNIDKYVVVGKSHKILKRSVDKVMSDCLEAIIGAIYLDNGIKLSEKFVLNSWKGHLDKSEVAMIDPKTRLQEYSLKIYKELPKYTFYKKSGPQHTPLFKIDVQIKNSKKFIGFGKSKKKAQQDAAKKLLNILNIT